MPTIRSISQLNEQAPQNEQTKRDVVKQLITRFPYKEYGISEDGRDGSLVVTFPGGMKIRMQRKTVEYYAEAAGLEQNDSLEPVAHAIDEVANSEIKERSAKLKDVTREFATSEYRPEKYSFGAYLLGQKKLSIDQIRALYDAYCDDDLSGLDAGMRKVYEKAVSYALAYYKFLVGMFAVIA